MQRTHLTTVADLRAAIADLPDWALVEVISYDEEGMAEEHDPYLDYSRGVLTIDAA
jgi:hypothetical protein